MDGGGDPCRSPAFNSGAGPDAAIYRPVDQPGDLVWVETPAITHTRDYFSYEDFVRPGFPTDWRAANLVDGQLWLRVEVLETAPGATFPIYYTVTWGPGVDGRIQGFLRAAVEINRAGPAVYEEVADVREIEYSPDGTCCQSVCARPWPWDNAWRSVAGDVVARNARGFPIRVRTRIVLRPARR